MIKKENNKEESCKKVIAYGQKIITDMSLKDIPEEKFNKQDLLYIKQNRGHFPYVFKKSM